eukprot:CAMPEP_0204576132 /NCGR_PEP_ID=MMETSP0661-20131031/41598_1 /ASSEMBLY_ACC=CAM_ASM_000606 /TAXON_ID=109239 /ORGANISM="Alexandrium margalefi, Strain AMGDE01CS-322" /LENGTH=231 /DNA_ID=CAMNT_0051584849 /DNA_START=11 /DNA_END=703 /DNA_ORIENTATION=+
MQRAEVLGWDNFDDETKLTVQRSDNKVPLIMFWWYCNVSRAIDEGMLKAPPPLLSRVYDELGAGIVHAEDAVKLKTTPFPFHYTQATVWLLWLHWILTPLVVTKWTRRPSLAFLIGFVLVFVVWALFYISQLLEQPFGEDDSDVDLVELHQQTNSRLLVLLSPQAARAPRYRESRRGGLGDMAGRPAACLFRLTPGPCGGAPGGPSSDEGEEEEEGEEGDEESACCLGGGY